MYRDNLDINKQICPSCKQNKTVRVGNWGLIGRIDDWFYYCTECDCTWED